MGPREWNWEAAAWVRNNETESPAWQWLPCQQLKPKREAIRTRTTGMRMGMELELPSASASFRSPHSAISPSLFHSVSVCVCVCWWLSAFKNLGQSSEHKQNLDDDGYLTMLNNKWVDTYTHTYTYTYMQYVSLDMCVCVCVCMQVIYWVAHAWVLVWVWVLWNNECDCDREKRKGRRKGVKERGSSKVWEQVRRDLTDL